MRIDFRRFFFIIGVMWILLLWLLFAVYGALRFWERHVEKWVFGGTTAEIVSLCILGLSIFWILFIIKTIKDELDEQDAQPLDKGIEPYKGMPIGNTSGNKSSVVAR